MSPLHLMEDGGKKPSTTTLSTIVLKSGDCKLVVALLKSGHRIHVEVMEIEPNLAYLGETFEEAAQLQSAHLDVLRQLQSKQSPVEDLLRQADELIVTQKPKAGVYAAMAESLGAAWQDLHNILDQRRAILDKNFLFKGHLQDYMAKADNFHESISRARSSQKNANSLMSELLKGKRKMLEASVFALQEGDGLLNALNQTWLTTGHAVASKDVRFALSRSIEQVEQWMETIYEKRLMITQLFDEVTADFRKSSLQQQKLDQLESMESLLANKLNYLESRMYDLGASSANVNSMMEETLELIAEAKTIYKEESVGNVVSGLDSPKALQLQEMITMYHHKLEMRIGILQEAKAIFEAAHDATQKLNEIEAKLRSIDVVNDSAAKLDAITRVTEEIITDIYDRGARLIEKSGGPEREGGVRHLKAEIDQLLAKGNNVKNAINLMQHQAKRSSATWKNFQTKLDEMDTWLENNTFLAKSHRDMGSTLEQAMQFSAVCKDALSSVQLKIYELEGMKGAFKIMLDGNTSTETAREIEEKLTSVQQKVLQALSQIELTLSHSTKYVKLLNLTNDLSTQMQSLEDQLLVIKGSKNAPTTKQQYEVQRLSIQQLYLQVCNFSKNLVRELNECEGNMTNREKAIKNINHIMENINRKQTALIDIWNIITAQKNEESAIEQQVSQAKKLSHDLLSQAKSIERNVYPLINAEDEPSVIVSSLEKSYTSMSQMRILAETLTQLEQSISKMAETNRNTEEMRELCSHLKSGSASLKEQINRLEALMQLLITFVKRIAEAKMVIKELKNQYTSPIYASNLCDLEILAQQHEASKKSTSEKVQNLLEESQNVQNNITQFEQEMQGLKVVGGNSGLRELVNSIQVEFSKAWQDRKSVLTKQAKLCLLTDNLNNLNAQIDASVQLIKSKTNLDDDSKTLTMSTSFMDTFNANDLKTLTKNANECLHQGEALETELPEYKSTIQIGCGQLREKVLSFESLLGKVGAKLKSAKEYFSLFLEIESYFKDANRSLLSLRQKAAAATSNKESIKIELEEFMARHKRAMAPKLTNLTKLAHESFGNSLNGKTKCIQDDFEAFYDSLTKFLIDLNNKIAEAEAARQAKLTKLEAESHLRAAKAEASFLQSSSSSLICQHKQSVITKCSCESEQPPPRPPPPTPIAPMFKENLQDLVLLEGERCSFKARVSGDPVPKITWFKDGVSVQNNPDYKAHFDATTGKCELLIEETFIADSANWSIRASNIGGYAESHAKLTVREPQPAPPKSSPPAIVMPLKQVHVKEGEKAVFTCQVMGTPVPKVTWYKNETILDNCHLHNYTIQDMNGEGKLTIDGAKPRDSAVYYCKATNPYGAVSSSASLVVQPLEPCEVPIFQEPLVNLETTTGSSMKLECQVRGTPKPDITWMHNNRSLPKNIGVETSYDPESGVACLLIKEAFPKASGKYTCRARNTAGEATSTAVVTVKGIPPMEVSDSDVVNDSPPVGRPSKPAFYVPLKNMECYEGEEVIFETVIVSTPGPEKVLWYRNNVPIRDLGNFVIKQYGDVFQLIIKEVDAADKYGGEYKVRAINVAGECQSTCTLTVKQKSTYLDPKQYPVDPDSKEDFQPYFRKKLVGLSCDAGDSVQLEAEVEGKPRPTIQWFQDEQLLQSNPPWLLIERNESTCSLIIHRAEERKATGSYRVVAINYRGSASSEADIEVRPPPPRPPLPAAAASSPSPPKRPPSPKLIAQEQSRKIINESLKTVVNGGTSSLVPDEAQSLARRKMVGKVPKPSKFCKGEMYFSDYDSDWGDAVIPVKWRPYHSDTEDLEPMLGFRSVRPKLKATTKKAERCPSPPCPHQWESHEDIERLEKELRKPSKLSGLKQGSSKKASTTSYETSSLKISSLKTLSSNCQVSRPASALPTTTEASPLTRSHNSPTLISRNSQQKTEFVSVKEKAKLLEQQLENLDDECVKRSSTSDNNGEHHGSTIKPEEIPGAVRVLPPASRGFSTSRSASADLFGLTSPVNVPRSEQSSPMTLPRSVIHNKHYNNSKSEWSSSSSTLDCRSKSIPATVEKLQTRQNFETTRVVEEQREQSSSNFSSSHCAKIQHSYSSDLGFFSMPDEDIPPTIELKAFKTNEKAEGRSSVKRQDGYEADTDDTLSRKSVKDLAKSFNQQQQNGGELDQHSSSARLFQPSGTIKEARQGNFNNESNGQQQPCFIASGAYVPPKWADGCESPKILFKPTKFVPASTDSLKVWSPTPKISS